MKKIPLTQEKFALVDDKDYDWLSRYKWSYVKGGNTGYAKRSVWIKENRSYRSRSMQVEILEAKKGDICDHIDGDGLNNTRENLRIVDHSANSANRLNIKNHNKHGFPGIWKVGNSFCARIILDKKNLYLGTFYTAEEAAICYKEKFKSIYGIEHRFYRQKTKVFYTKDELDKERKQAQLEVLVKLKLEFDGDLSIFDRHIERIKDGKS